MLLIPVQSLVGTGARWWRGDAPPGHDHRTIRRGRLNANQGDIVAGPIAKNHLRKKRDAQIRSHQALDRLGLLAFKSHFRFESGAPAILEGQLSRVVSWRLVEDKSLSF